MQNKTIVMPITELEMELLNKIRKIKVEYGKVIIYIRQGQPERIETTMSEKLEKAQ